MLNRTDLRDQGHGSHARWLSLPKRESRPFWISGCLCDSRRLQSTSKNILLKSVGINSAARGVMPALPRLASAAKTPPAGPGLSPRIVWLHFPWILPAICVGPSTGAPCHAIARAMPLEPKQEKPALTGLPFPPHRPGSRQQAVCPFSLLRFRYSCPFGLESRGHWKGKSHHFAFLSSRKQRTISRWDRSSKRNMK